MVSAWQTTVTSLGGDLAKKERDQNGFGYVELLLAS